MSKPIQLIINQILLPTQTHDRYRCYSTKLSEQLTMIAGNMVEEIRPGQVQLIEYTCDAMDHQTYQNLLAALRSNGPLDVAYLPDDGAELVVSKFLVTSFEPPSLSFFEGTTPVWHNLSFTLREVNPHDPGI